MPIIARFILAAEAAVFQTLLEEKGIPSTLLDSGSNAIDRNNTATVAIDVPREHVAHALAVHAIYSTDNQARANATERAHPNKGYPFFTVWAFATVALVLFSTALCLTRVSSSDADTDTCLLLFGVILVSSIFWGLAITGGIAFARMIPSAFPAVFKRNTGGEIE